MTQTNPQASGSSSVSPQWIRVLVFTAIVVLFLVQAWQKRQAPADATTPKSVAEAGPSEQEIASKLDATAAEQKSSASAPESAAKAQQKKTFPAAPATPTASSPTVSQPKDPVHSGNAKLAGIRTQIENQTIRDLDRNVVFRGTVDLTESILRIQRGEELSQFRNDGVIFENREKRLPKHGTGYYREWVHPTPKQAGPGPQRIVTGEAGEFWYTPDHYRTFIRLN